MVAIRNLGDSEQGEKATRRVVSERSEGSKQPSMRRRSSRVLFGSANNGNPADTSQLHALYAGSWLAFYIGIGCPSPAVVFHPH
jgi:hypothetical protein